ncbi:MAG: YchJ family protein [Proteobacteria bacterium]|nr:YchJ family protein [Pseudomonadota bacterium]MBU1641207.1 YchJ family protein [Pseudomonadota bacterium]
MPKTTTCPCGNNQMYASCCNPYIERGKLPPTAEALMRSRYSAFALSNGAYLLRTWHPSTAPNELNLETSAVWCGLEVLATEGGKANDDKGMVEFKAQYINQGKVGTLHEVSRFIKQEGRWLYVDGDLRDTSCELQKVGRNEPCPCGSGKKFKKCCGP